MTVQSINQSGVGHLKGFDHGFTFVQRFLVFQGWIRISNDSRSHLNVDTTLAHDKRADGYTEVHVARQAEVTDCTRIKPSSRWFQFVDDFHGSHLWSP